MKKISTEYQVILQDFRKATYYSVIRQNHKPILIMFFALVFSFVYLLSALAHGAVPNYLVFFVAAAELIWGIMLFAAAERDIRKYMTAPNSLLGCTFSAEFQENRIRIHVPGKNINFSSSISHLACVFEYSSIYMIYPTAQETYIIPARAFTDEERLALREHLASKLGDRFFTYRKKKKSSR